MLITKKLRSFTRPHHRSIVAFGVFDGLHRGHQDLVRRLTARARRGRANSVIVTFDPHPQLVLKKSQWPMVLTTLAEKERLLADLGVDIMGIIRFTRTTAALGPSRFVEDVLVKTLSAAEVICGQDCGFGQGRAGDLDLLRRLGAANGFAVSSLRQRSYQRAKISSTKIREALLAGNLGAANRMLGRPYQLSGTVIAGHRVGRTLGFRTANMMVSDPAKLIPSDGVYAATARIGDRTYPGMLYIGNRPTFRGSRRQVEFHAFDAKRSFYGRRIVIDLLEFIRPDSRFATAPALARAIGRDEQTIRRMMLKLPAARALRCP